MNVRHNQMSSRETQGNKESFLVGVEDDNRSISSTNVNVAKVMINVQNKFEKLPKDAQKPCIFKIPEIFRTVSVYNKNKAYTPCRIAIGPYHAKNSDLEPMQQYKLKFVIQFLSYGTEHPQVDKQLFRKNFAETLLVPENILKARKCYARSRDHYPSSDTSFEEMMLVDGAFIVGFLCKYANSSIHINIEDELTVREIREILRDILLLENQLPFFILDQTFKFFFPDTEHHFVYIAYRALIKLIPIDRDKELPEDKVRKICFTGNLSRHDNEESIRDFHVKHLLHLMLICCLPTVNAKELKCIPSLSYRVKPKTFLSHPFRSITELYEVGVKFKRIVMDEQMVVAFNNGVLHLPRLTLDEFTESIFRNMVAFELYYLNMARITSYVHLMDHLIDTPSDVQLLEQYDLLENWLESKENVSTIFNNISKHTINNYQFPLHDSVSREMNEYVNKRWNRWKAKLCHEYFGTPWLVVSFFAALLLLILTIIQAITSLRQVNWI